MTATSFVLPELFRRLRSRLPRWNVLTNSQKVALITFISLTIFLPIVTLATLTETRLSSRAETPITPPMTPTGTPTFVPIPTLAPLLPVDWKSRTSWLKADYLYFSLGAKDVGEKIFTGQPDPGTTIKIDDISTNKLAVSWMERGVSLSLSIFYEVVPKFDSGKSDYVVSGLTISDGVITDTYRPVWTTRAGYPYTTTKEEAFLPVKQSHPDLIGVLYVKNIYWHPGLYPLNDLDFSKWSWKHVQKIFPTRIMTPVADGLFDPEGEITRADMASFLIRTYEYITGKSGPEVDTPFSDISHLPLDVQSSIKKIYGLKITAGTSATTYSPELKINRAQMATFLSNMYRAVYGEYAPEVATPFTDIWNEDIKWAQKPIARIYGLKVTAGISPTEFGPYLNVTREQMATFIMNFIEATQRIPIPRSTPPSVTLTPIPTSLPSPFICEPRCGDGVCQQVTCLGTGCACTESAASCPQDCVSLSPEPKPTPKPILEREGLKQSLSDLVDQLVDPASRLSSTPTPIPTPILEFPPEASPAQVNIFVRIINLVQDFFLSLFR